MGERGQKCNEEKWRKHRTTEGFYFLYTIRNNYSRRRRQTHPFLKVFIIKSSWDQWFQLAVDNHTQQQRGLHLGYLRPQSDRCLCFNFILRDSLPGSWTCCCSWGGREERGISDGLETMQTPSSVFSAPTPGSNWVWRWTGRLSSGGVWGRAWAGREQEVSRICLRAPILYGSAGSLSLQHSDASGDLHVGLAHRLHSVCTCSLSMPTDWAEW